LPKNIYFPQNKADFATQKSKPNILIDDFLPYIQSWKTRGGYSIQMRTDMFNTKREIEKFLLKELEIAKQKLNSN
jgi:isochorismate hydrolase